MFLFGRLSDYMVFEEVIKQDYSEPHCLMDSVSSVAAYDHVPGVSSRLQLQYAAETGLKEVCGWDCDVVFG